MGAVEDAKNKVEHLVEEVKDHLPHKKAGSEAESEPADFSQDLRHGGGETPGSSAPVPDDV